MNSYYGQTQRHNLIQHSDSIEEKRYFKFYVVLLEVLMVFSIIAVVLYIWSIGVSSSYNNELVLLSTSIWSFAQCFIEFKAIKEKSLGKATIALVLMTLYTIPSILYVWKSIQRYFEIIIYPDNGAGLAMVVIGIFSICFLLHIITLFGAFKVYKSLKERASAENLA